MGQELERANIVLAYPVDLELEGQYSSFIYGTSRVGKAGLV